jgi:hypothetical protein
VLFAVAVMARTGTRAFKHDKHKKTEVAAVPWLRPRSKFRTEW